MVSFFCKRLNEVSTLVGTSVNLFWSGGDKRDRTADLLNAIQALSQLSYTPILQRWFFSLRRFQVRVYVRWTRFSAEKPRRLKQSPGLFLRAGFRVHFGFPWTLVSGLWNRFPHFQRFLSLVGQNGLEPSTSRLSVVCSSQLSYWPILPLLFKSAVLAAPSKLNNVKVLTLCTDLRTLQLKSSFQLKSP